MLRRRSDQAKGKPPPPSPSHQLVVDDRGGPHCLRHPSRHVHHGDDPSPERALGHFGKDPRMSQHNPSKDPGMTQERGEGPQEPTIPSP